MPIRLQAESARFDVADVARKYLRRGWQPVPIGVRQKAPRRSAWQSLPVTEANVEDYFEADDNVGLQLGERSRGLTDVDLDCTEALQLADDILPATGAIFGRQSKPASHRLYVTSLGDSQNKAALRFQEPPALCNGQPATLVELRIGARDKAAQTLAPGSVHPSGEEVRWDSEGEPASVPGDDLKKAVAALAVAALLVRNYPAAGSRHDAALVLGGALARVPSTSGEAIKKFVAAVARCAGDQEADERGASAAGAVALLQHGQPTPGIPRMRELWGAAVADTVATWLGVGVDDDRPILPVGAPLPAAEEFLVRCHSDGNIRLLHHYRGGFYRFEGTHYSGVTQEEIERQLYKFLKNALVQTKDGVAPFNPTKQKIDQIVHALRRGTLIPQDVEAPFWLDDPKRPAKDLVACRNGILNLRTRELIQSDSTLFCTNALPLDYDPNAPKPERWFQFLEEIWPTDEPAERCLQEIFGYLLTDDTRQQKLFLIWGPKRAGKGTIVDILEQLLGPSNVVYQTLKSMAGEFGRWPLIDKKLCCVTDARLGPKTDTAALAETMLSISGGDPQTINRKLMAFWTGYLGVRFLITTNDLPRINDPSGTLPSRFILLRLTESFYNREDLQLKDKLRPELPGILNWALDGLTRLSDRGHFEMPKSSRDAMRQLEDLASPVNAFVREWCEVGPKHEIRSEDLYAAYRAWCEVAGHKPAASSVFGRDLHGLISSLKTKRPQQQRRWYVGIKLNEEGQEQADAAAADVAAARGRRR